MRGIQTMGSDEYAVFGVSFKATGAALSARAAQRHQRNVRDETHAEKWVDKRM